MNGTWDNAIEVPGTAAFYTGTGRYAFVCSVSCPPAGSCAAGGFYTDTSLNAQAFVVSQH